MPSLTARLTQTFLAVVLLAGSALVAPAQVTFNVTATADSTGFGYTAGQTVHFIFQTTTANISGNAGSGFNASQNYWVEDFTSSVQLFTSVSGTGLAGTFTRPTASSGDPFSVVAAYPPGYSQLTLLASAETGGSSIGLTAGGYAVTSLRADLLDWGQTFTMPGVYTPLATYFASYAGTHALNPGGYVEFFAAGSPVDFTPTSITISAVPESSTYALVFGVIGLAAAQCLRRRPRAAQGRS